MSLKDKVIFISGGSRGIGLAMAKKAAADGAKIVVAAKTADPHPKLPGTIYTAAEEIIEAGGEALPIICDIRSEDNVRDAINKSVILLSVITLLRFLLSVIGIPSMFLPLLFTSSSIKQIILYINYV